MKNGKIIICLCVMVITLYWSPVYANFINVISQEYIIWGEGVFYGSNPPLGQSFNITSDTAPVYESISEAREWAAEEGWLGYGLYDIAAFSDGSVTLNNAWLHIWAYANDEAMAYSLASASASIIFQPISLSFMSVNMSGDEGYSGNFKLLDLTSNTSLLPSLGDPFWPTNYFEKSLTFSFDPTHVYSMSVEIPPLNFNRRDFHLSLVPVSEPVTTLLLALSFFGITGVVRKLQK